MSRYLFQRYCTDYSFIPFIYIIVVDALILPTDLPVQAQYHADIAKNIMLSGLHTSDSSSSKAELLLMLVKMYYVLGRAFTMMKKYP